MTDKFKKELSESLDITTDLLPYLPELVTDLWALGSSPELIIKILKPLSLPASSRILDLGCGKGVVSIALARQFGFNTVGIDGMKAFLEEARDYAIQHKVNHLCQFIYMDIHEAVKNYTNYDIVIYASIGGTLGSYKKIVGKIRGCIKPGGLMIIDDGFLKGSTKIKMEGYGHYISYENTIAQLTSHGDKILEEIIVDPEEIQKMDQEYTRFLSKRAANLAKKKPELKDKLAWYMKNQEEACHILEKDIEGVIWLIQRAKSSTGKYKITKKNNA